MATADENRRRLWLIFAAGFAISIVGGVILFSPTLEFFVVDVIEKLKLPIGLIGNIAMIGDFSLFILCGLGLIVMGIHRAIKSRKLREI